MVAAAYVIVRTSVSYNALTTYFSDISTDMQVYFVNTVHGRCHAHENIAK